jgi:hypothetical protein
MSSGQYSPVRRGQEGARDRRFGSPLLGTRRRRLAATAFVALAFYVYAWAVQPNRPQLAAVFDDPPKLLTVTENGFRPGDAGTPLAQYQSHRWGWIGQWYDQFHYARMARAIGRGHLPGVGWDPVHMVAKDPAAQHEVASFSYGLGYPAVGAVFYVLGFKGDPFVVPDALLFALSAMLALVVAERFLNAAMALIVVNVLVLTGPFALYFVIPYGTSLTVVAVLTALVVITGDRFDWPVALALGTATAFAFAARYTDAIWIVALLMIPLLVRRRSAWRVLVATAAELAVAAAVVGWAQWRAFGSAFTTPYKYVHGGLDASWSAYRFGHVANAGIGVFVTGDRSMLLRVEPILKSFPWAVAAPIGLVLLFVDRHPLRWTALLATVVALGSTVTYLAWVFGGTDQLEIWIIRYHIAWFPLWAILAGVAFERALATTGVFVPGPAVAPTDQSVALQE